MKNYTKELQEFDEATEILKQAIPTPDLVSLIKWRAVERIGLVVLGDNYLAEHTAQQKEAHLQSMRESAQGFR